LLAVFQRAIPLPLNLGVGLGDIIDEFSGEAFLRRLRTYRAKLTNAERFAALFAPTQPSRMPKGERTVSSRRGYSPPAWIQHQAAGSHELESITP